MFIRSDVKSSLYHLKAECPLLFGKSVETTLAECLDDELYSEKRNGVRISRRRELCSLCGGAK